MKMRIAPLWLALAGVCLAWIPPAGAQMANDLTIGNPKAMALGNAVTADETGIDSVHYNPAALTRMKGRQATVKLLTGVMDIRAGFKAPPNEIGCLPGMQEILEVFFNVCGGNIGPFQNLANIDLDMQQSLSPSFNLGVLWEPTDWFAWGATYQSESRMRLKGKYRVDYGQGWQGFWTGVHKSLGGAILGQMFPYGNVDEEHGNATMNMVYPDAFSTGVKLRPFKKWQFNFDLKWNGYSDWNEFKIEFDRELDLLRIAKYLDSKDATSHSITLDRGYRDTWSWAMGVQYDVNDRLQLRAGYEYRPSAIPKGQADILVPIGDANLYGLGLGYQWDKDTVIDVGFNYFVTKQSVKADTSCNLNCTGLDNLVYNPYAGLDVDTTVKAYIFAMTYRTTF